MPQDPEKKKGPIGPKQETPLSPDLLGVMERMKIGQAAVKGFETIAQGQQNENKALIDSAQGAAKVRETTAETHRKNAKARLDITAGLVKAEGDAVDLQVKKAQNSAVTGAVDDSFLDESIAAARPQGFPSFNPAGETVPGATLGTKLGEVDPRSDRLNQFGMLGQLENQDRLSELLKAQDELVALLRQGTAEAQELDILNSPLGRGGVLAGGLLNLLSLPVTLFTGGQGLGTQLLGGQDVDTLNSAVQGLRAINPQITNQIGITRTRIQAEEGMQTLALRNAANFAKAQGFQFDELDNRRFAGAMQKQMNQFMANTAQTGLAGDEAVLWTGNAVDSQGRHVEAGAGLQLFRKFNQLNSLEANDPEVKDQLLKEFDQIMQGFYESTGVALDFGIFDRSITTLSESLDANFAGQAKPGLSEGGRKTFELTVSASKGFTELLNTDFRNFAKRRFEKVSGKLKKTKKTRAEQALEVVTGAGPSTIEQAAARQTAESILRGEEQTGAAILDRASKRFEARGRDLRPPIGKILDFFGSTSPAERARLERIEALQKAKEK